jgi:hypothetical protein
MNGLLFSTVTIDFMLLKYFTSLLGATDYDDDDDE